MLRWLVRRGVLRRGHGRLLSKLPGVWGGEVLEVQTDAGRMTLPVGESSSVGLLLHGRPVHEWRETLLVIEIARRESVLIDIGAHYGWYSVAMAGASPSSEVLAFEPDPATFRFLSTNLARFPHASAYAAALGASDGETTTLWRAPSRDLSSTTRRVGEPVQVSLRSLDRICTERGICPDFIKCDVEGSELEVLRGATTILASRHPPIWMLEVSRQFLSEAGHSDPDRDLRDMLFELSGGGEFWTQEQDGRPLRIESLDDVCGGNNIFFVPPTRKESFAVAALALERRVR